MKQLHGNLALVTGAAIGMGRKIAEFLLAEGCRLAMVDINPDALEKARQALASKGTCHAFNCDIADRDLVQNLAASVDRALVPVNILVNNAGIVRAASLMTSNACSVSTLPPSSGHAKRFCRGCSRPAPAISSTWPWPVDCLPYHL